MKLKVSFHLGLMSLSMCLVLFLLSGAVGMNSSTYGSGVSTAHTLQDYCYYEIISFGGHFFNANTQRRARNTSNMLASHENRFSAGKKKKKMHQDSQRSPSAPLVTLSARMTVTVNLWENCCSTCNTTFIGVGFTPSRHVGK